jgi:hypothetical protein
VLVAATVAQTATTSMTHAAPSSEMVFILVIP